MSEPRPAPAARAGDTTSDNPWPLRRLNENIKIYVDRMSMMWVEGQVVEYRPRPGTKLAYFVLRDLEADMSMRVSCFSSVLDQSGPGFEEGSRVVVRVKPNFWERTGSLDLRAHEIHLSGIGDLLARIEMLRRKLADEGIFDEARKKPLPFLPRIVGLVCGRNAKAKDDVVENASKRWPGVRFEIREVPVQGDAAIAAVSGAIAELDGMEGVDVIIVTRGGGSVEDLLPFSSEQIVRAASAAHTPIVSAIGHEADAPLLDLVADFRASTPTDAARRVVPDLVQELDGLNHATDALRAGVSRRIDRESADLDMLTSRPVLTHPQASIDSHHLALDTHIAALRRAVERTIDNEKAALAHLGATLTALSPQGTLERGYSLLRTPSGQIIRSSEDVKKGDLIEVVLAQGRMVAQVVGATKPPIATD